MTERRDWRKSSFSDSTGGDCVEVHHTHDAVRDTKNPLGLLRTSAEAFADVITAVKSEQFTH